MIFLKCPCNSVLLSVHTHFKFKDLNLKQTKAIDRIHGKHVCMPLTLLKIENRSPSPPLPSGSPDLLELMKPCEVSLFHTGAEQDFPRTVCMSSCKINSQYCSPIHISAPDSQGHHSRQVIKCLAKRETRVIAKAFFLV